MLPRELSVSLLMNHVALHCVVHRLFRSRFVIMVILGVQVVWVVVVFNIYLGGGDGGSWHCLLLALNLYRAGRTKRLGS